MFLSLSLLNGTLLRCDDGFVEMDFFMIFLPFDLDQRALSLVPTTIGFRFCGSLS